MDDLFEHAMESERDKAINGFYTHFIMFLAVIAGLAIINLIEGEHFWVQWVVLGWGAGIALHAYKVFVVRAREEHAKHEAFRAREQRRMAAASAADAAALAEAGTGQAPADAADDDQTRRL
ncbi:2TM domain-containing protein [Hyphomicrobium sp.]|jgi:hypothetical protein|uniref:2TM domain-containing protein n=1 Tax=Hyphomicrobium sp. TaxID=82 RepID=UPI0025C1D264|nr:2TM domain-containing protein [Hyphomicrobium sp.]